MVSILFGHYSEDTQRDEIALKSLISASKQRTKDIELVITFNGIYPYRDEFIQYCDQWNERKADAIPGKTINLGIKQAKGDMYFIMSNDVLLYDGAVEECVQLSKLYPQYIISPIYPPRYKNKLNVPFGEYITNNRAGDLVNCMTKKQIEDIGMRDEVALLSDEINYMNRRIAKGYTVLLTKKPMGEELAPNVHSFKSQMKGWKGYRGEKPIYSKEELTKLSYE